MTLKVQFGSGVGGWVGVMGELRVGMLGGGVGTGGVKLDEMRQYRSENQNCWQWMKHARLYTLTYRKL